MPGGPARAAYDCSEQAWPPVRRLPALRLAAATPLYEYEGPIVELDWVK
jgi:hypothetical protein